jgi:hypothetical protein
MTGGNAFEQLRPFPRTRHPDLIAVVEADVVHSIPGRLVGRCEVRLVVLHPEIEAALVLGDAGQAGFVGLMRLNTLTLRAASTSALAPRAESALVSAPLPLRTW